MVADGEPTPSMRSSTTSPRSAENLVAYNERISSIFTTWIRSPATLADGRCEQAVSDLSQPAQHRAASDRDG